MAKLQRVLAVLFLCLAPALFAQSADQAVTASDSMDPVVPGVNYTYTIQVQNNGPDAATNGGVNILLGGNIEPVAISPPAGFTCTALSAIMSCTKPSFGSGESATITLTARVAEHRLNFPDGSVSATFTTSGTTADPVNGNNSTTVTTAWDSPQVDLSVAASDSPDPVGPDQNITYTIDVANAGPDTATNVNFSVFNNGTLRFQSATVPAGWNCTLPAVGAFPQFSCTRASFASGASSTFTVVVSAERENLGIFDGSVSTVFTVNGTGDDTNDENNTEQETTAYVTPDADLSITATDSPDPVGRDQHITYTVTLANAGPDTAEATLQVPMNGFLKFVSMTVPAGFVCSGVPAPGSAASYSCIDTTFAPGDTAQFTIVMHTDPETFGIHDGVINQPFAVTGNWADPNNDNNQVNVATTYDPTTADVGVTATDAPDPVNAGSNITYTGTVTNAGPDAAPSVTLTIPLHPSLLFQSLTPPTGFSCTTPAVGANGTITCTIASLANGANLGFTVVAQVNPSVANGPDGIIEQGFLIGSSAGDPSHANNELDVFTQYLTPDADISVTNSDTPDPVAPGGVITYTQTITNNGPDTATNVVFSETLPASVGFVSIVPAAGFTCTTPAVGASGTINCTRASLASGGTGTFTVVVDVLTTSGTIGNTVTGDSDTFDPDASDNTATTSTTVLAADSADLGVTKSTNTTAASPGTDIVYTIVLTNNGPDDATTVVLTDTLPAQLQFRSITEPAGFDCVTPAVGATGTITCSAATLADGATATFTLTARVAPGATSGTVTNSATATSATGDANGGNNTGNAGGVTLSASIADVSIVKNTASATAPAGSTFSYTIAVTNSGPNAATNVVMTDVLPAQLLFESIAIPTGFTCTTPAVGANGTITCTAATLANGVTRTFTLNVRVTPPSPPPRPILTAATRATRPRRSPSLPRAPISRSPRPPAPRLRRPAAR
jgi:uncharacterized repeat protein (TIGR01451 family)